MQVAPLLSLITVCVIKHTQCTWRVTFTPYGAALCQHPPVIMYFYRWKHYVIYQAAYRCHPLYIYKIIIYLFIYLI